MAVNVQFATVADSISALSISGVTVKDVDAIISTYTAAPKTLAPRPDGYISNITVTRDSFGTGGAEKLTLSYTLTYRYYHTSLGVQLNFADFAAMIANIELIAEAFITNDALTGLIDLTLEGIGEVGPVNDPSGAMFHGCDFILRITEFPT